MRVIHLLLQFVLKLMGEKERFPFQIQIQKLPLRYRVNFTDMGLNFEWSSIQRIVKYANEIFPIA